MRMRVSRFAGPVNCPACDNPLWLRAAHILKVRRAGECPIAYLKRAVLPHLRAAWTCEDNERRRTARLRIAEWAERRVRCADLLSWCRSII